jgi:excisionase family DNA binding protein
MTAQSTPSERLLTPAEVAALVFVDPKTVSRWAQSGKIPFVRTPGGHRRFRISDVQAIMPRDRSRDQLHHETVGPLLKPSGVERGDVASAADPDRAGVTGAVAEKVAIALAEKGVLDTPASVASAAETAAPAAVGARLARAFAAAQAEELHQEGERLATETARVQRLAVRVGVVTATLGAVFGGFAGAVAARVVGI